MDERRAMMRERVIYGATADTGVGRSRPCVVRNMSASGARLQFSSALRVPDDLALTIASKGRAYQARVVWWRDNAAGVVFAPDGPSVVPSLDLEQRLRDSEKKTRQLKRRLRELTGG